MRKQSEALRLADVVDAWRPAVEAPAVAAELRRLHALNAELLEALRECAERLEIHMRHTEDLMAHMRAHKAIAKATGEQA